MKCESFIANKNINRSSDINVLGFQLRRENARKAKRCVNCKRHYSWGKYCLSTRRPASEGLDYFSSVQTMVGKGTREEGGGGSGTTVTNERNPLKLKPSKKNKWAIARSAYYTSSVLSSYCFFKKPP